MRNKVDTSHAITEQHSGDDLFVSLTLGLSTPKREDSLPFLSFLFVIFDTETELSA